MQFFSTTTFFILLAAALPSLSGPVGLNATSLNKRQIYTGQGTYFHVGLGACGEYNEDSDPIVALSTSLYGNGGYCNQWVTITNTENGVTASGQVRDECPGCNTYDLDMSPSLFEQLASLDEGRINISWNFD